MKHNIAKEILNTEKDKLMLEPEATRDWELITALEIAIEAVKEIDNYGNCVLTMFGDCSYEETGCSDCKIKEKIREALKDSSELTLDNVMMALGIVRYTEMIDLLTAVYTCDYANGVAIINKVYMAGCDLKLFIKSLTDFMLDVCKKDFVSDFTYLNCPNTDEIRDFFKHTPNRAENRTILSNLIRLGNDIKWDTNPKARIEAWVITGE